MPAQLPIFEGYFQKIETLLFRHLDRRKLIKLPKNKKADSRRLFNLDSTFDQFM